MRIVGDLTNNHVWSTEDMSESIASKHAELLNRINEMIQAPCYALAAHTLVKCELVIINQETELSRLNAKVAELQKDARRLDYCENHGTATRWQHRHPEPIVMKGWQFPHTDPYIFFDTLREAIDAQLSTSEQTT